jgi:hypothetical protein
MIRQRSARTAAVATAPVLAPAGCAQTTSGHPAGAGNASVNSTKPTDFPSQSPGFPSSDSSGSGSSSGSSSGGALSKAGFVTQMNAVCSSISKTLERSVPSSDTDYAALRAFFTETLALYQTYITQAKRLAAETADADLLNEKWISIEEADFDRAKPVLLQLIVAAGNEDKAKIDQLESQLDKLPDHSSDIADFMTGYGLTDCADLESG